MDYAQWLKHFEENLWLVYEVTLYSLYGRVSVEQLFDEGISPFNAAIEARTRFLEVTQHVACLDAESDKQSD